MPLTLVLLLEAGSLPVGPFWHSRAVHVLFLSFQALPFKLKEESCVHFRSYLCETHSLDSLL